MNAVQPDSLDAVLRDPLAPVRAAGGGVGFVGFDFPQDLAFALARPALHLPWQADRPTPFADRWLESSFPGISCSILQDWSAGTFDGLESVVFSRGDDASQRLYYYVCELQRRGRLAGPQARVLDVARIPRATSLVHTRRALSDLVAELGVSADALRQGIARTNALRSAFASLAGKRSGDGVAVHRLARASLFADVTAWSSQGAAQGVPPPRLRVLLVGSAPPDERLHEAVARAGGGIVGETHAYGLGRLGPALDARAEDPVAEIAGSLHRAAGPRSFEDPTRLLEGAADAAHAEAAILWLTREDEALAWHVPAIRRSFAARGMPLLELTVRRFDADDGTAAEIERFIERIPS